ncbi:MAG TPA: transcription initiation factor IIB [Nitrososphaeraceae archaeon]|nr:transcription initiation factor IIB [Nitrososphaeraceae archaeon]
MITDKSEDISNPEWRAFTLEEKNSKSRTGKPTSLAKHDRGLATIISKTDRDASGRKFDDYTYSTFKRLRTWDVRSQYYSSRNRNFALAFSQLDILKDKLGLPDVLIERVGYMYRKAQERELTRGRSISAIVSAAVYISCREIGIPRTLRDVAAASNLKRKDIARHCRLIIRELDLRVPMADPMKCIVKIANKANLSESITRLAMNMMTQIIQRGISAGKNPMSLAATVLYISSIKAGTNITQFDIARAAGITEVTIRNRMRELKKYMNEIVCC